MKFMWPIFWIIAITLVISSFVVATAAYGLPPPPNSTKLFEAIKAFLLCLGGAGVILSTYFTAVNAFIQRRSNQIENTFDLLSSWDDPHLFQARKLTRKYKDKKDSTSNDQLINEIESNDDLKHSVILVLNYFEHIRFSLETNRIDKNLFKKSLGKTVIDITDRFMPFAKKLGAETATDLNNLKKQLE